MNQTLQDFLQAESVDSAMLRHATRYYIADRYGDLPPAKMLTNLEKAGAPRATVDAAQKQLEEDARMIDNACLALLSIAWREEGEQQRIRNAMTEAKSKLPVIEIAVMASVAMYAMYLAATGGKSKVVVERNPDGSYKETTEYHSPTGPLGSLVNLVKPGK